MKVKFPKIRFRVNLFGCSHMRTDRQTDRHGRCVSKRSAQKLTSLLDRRSASPVTAALEILSGNGVRSRAIDLRRLGPPPRVSWNTLQPTQRVARRHMNVTNVRVMRLWTIFRTGALSDEFRIGTGWTTSSSYALWRRAARHRFRRFEWS
jgi:hypothetical protein